MLPGAALDRVPAVVERVQREVTLARFIGKLAVDQGVRELRQRVESALSPVPPAAPARRTERRPEPPAADDRRDAHDRLDEQIEAVPTVEALALADYDELPAAHIVAKLPSLDAEERAAVAAYEAAHRKRRTVLGRIDQLDRGRS